MTLGYRQPRYLLPFDHRHSCLTGMFDFTPPLTAVTRKEPVCRIAVRYQDGRRSSNGDSHEDQSPRGLSGSRGHAA
jgi:hypothetical protein